jgi:hypothetical protein
MGAIREVLSVPEYWARVQKVMAIDGLHTGYDGGKPGPLDSKPEPDHPEIFLKFAQDAAAGRKALLIAHSEIFPRNSARQSADAFG